MPTTLPTTEFYCEDCGLYVADVTCKPPLCYECTFMDKLPTVAAHRLRTELNKPAKPQHTAIKRL